MADFVAVLRKTIDSLGDNTPEMREKVFDKARATIESKLAAITPPPPQAVAERQRKALEDAIDTIRADYAAKPPARDPVDELEDVFASLKDIGLPKSSQKTEPAKAEPPRAAVAVPAPVVAPVRPPAPAPAGRAFETAPRPADPPRPAAQPAASERPAVSPAAPAPAKPASPAPAANASAPVPPLPRTVDPVPGAGDGDDGPALAAADTGGRLAPEPRREKRRRGFGAVAAAAVVLVAFAAGGYGIYVNRDDFAAMVGLGPDAPAVAEDDAATTAEELVQSEAPETPAPPAAVEEEQDVAALPPVASEPAAPPPASDPQKFTQRLLPDGSEVDEGPAGGRATVGEGTSVAAAVRPEAPAEPETATDAQGEPAAQAGGETAAAQAQPPAAGQTAAPAAVPVGQRAIFYEERTSAQQGSADTGNIVWSVVQESPGGDLPPEPAIRAEASIPGRDVQLRMTIRRNGDRSLPASHIIEMIFLTPDGFEGGGISSVSRISFKENEQAAGSPLIGIPAKIADGFFLIALGNAPAEIQANETLLARQSWIDIPITYQSGRRALLSIEKGIPGDRVFQEALRAWQQASSG